MNGFIRSALALVLLCLLSGCVTNYWLTPENATSEQMAASLNDFLTQNGFVPVTRPASVFAASANRSWEKTYRDWLGPNGSVTVTQTTDGGHPVVIVHHDNRKEEGEKTAKDLLRYLNTSLPTMHVTLKRKTTCCDT